MASAAIRSNAVVPVLWIHYLLLLPLFECDWLSELRLKVPVKNISVTSGLLPERAREKNGID